MKFGAHSYIFVDQWTDDCVAVLEQARALGAECVDIGIGDDVEFSPELMRRSAEQLQLDLMVSPGGAWPLECDLSSENPDEREAGLRWHKKSVNLAAEMGAIGYAGSIYGHTGVVKRRRPLDQEIAWTADGLNQVAEFGASRGVVVAIEPMSHFRTHIVNTPSQAMRLIELADHDNLQVLLDTYHLSTEITDFTAGIHLVGDRLWGIHGCENNRGLPGTGILPWKEIFQALRNIGFDGVVVLETYNSSLGDFAYERGMFHNVCPDPTSFVQDGLQFLRSGLIGSRQQQVAEPPDSVPASIRNLPAS